MKAIIVETPDPTWAGGTKYSVEVVNDQGAVLSVLSASCDANVARFGRDTANAFIYRHGP